MFNKLVEWLSGKKTYLLMIGIISEALVEYLADQDLGKFVNRILVALGGMTIRAGVTKSSTPK